MRQRYNRTASTLITLFGAVTNSLLTIQVIAAWRSFKWEPESEWELSGDKWQITGVKVIWGLLSLYFASAATVCAVGLHGILNHKPSHVRFYRDYSIADFSFCAFFTALATYGAFLSPARATMCEELSHHPELMRDMLEMGLGLETCEVWLERAIFAVLAFMLVIMVIRLNFLLAVSRYYSHLSRHRSYHQRSASCSVTSVCLGSMPNGALQPASALAPQSMQRVFVVPSTSTADVENGVEMVYAQVPLHTLPKEIQDQATEAWIATSASSIAQSSIPAPSPHRHHHHRRHHHHGGHRHRSTSRETTGRIRLDIAPEEGLLPVYTAEPESDVKA